MAGKPNPNVPKWTEAEDEIIRTWYPRSITSCYNRLTNRPISSIRRRAAQINVAQQRGEMLDWDTVLREAAESAN